MARPLATLFVGLSVIAAPLAAPAEAERGAATPLAVACRSDQPKLSTPEAICALFVERVAARYPDRAVILQESPAPALTLVLLQASTQQFVARLDPPGGTGEAQGAGRFDAPLDDAARAALIDRLLDAAPPL
ncbi:hypothetical protein [Rhodobacter lacus]|uniref:Uncharacterized protein n=1 Tax=Rhodobacter lacus TaxID=1641972 RepID=A0ABW5A614_9RHOB